MGMAFKSFHFFILFLLATAGIFSSLADAAPLRGIPGLIALDRSDMPAVDLSYQGELLTVEQALNFRRIGGDLSSLEPVNSDLWSRNGQFDVAIDQTISVEEKSTVEFLSTVTSRTGNFRFSVSNGQTNYTVFVSKKGHNLLLRKRLLEKLGYQVPGLKHLHLLKVNFGSTFERENFSQEMAESTFGDPKRWIKSVDNDGKEITLQDVFVLSSDDVIYNLALGTIPSEIIKGRRVLNALLPAFALISPTESVNLFNFEIGRVISGSLKIDYEEADDFNTTFEDALWMARKISKLTRQDFVEIAAYGEFPTPVQKILVEKFVARRNSLLRLISLTDIPLLKFDAEVNDGKVLVKGKIMQEWWEGHGERFAYGDPEGPLTGKQVWNYFKSETISNVISNLVGSFNEYVVPSSDIQAEVVKAQQRKFEQAFEEFLETGIAKEIPVGVFAMPTWDVDLIASRDIVAGTYMGTDNSVQLADSFGVSLELGAYFSLDGPTGPWVANAGVRGRVTRRYSHMRPIKNLKAALKTPYRNMIVPLYKRKMGKKLESFNAQLINNLDDENAKAKISEALSDFEKDFEVGESLIITDSLGPAFHFGGGVGLSQLISAQLNFFGQQTILSRLHIHRRDENTIQIYRDYGNLYGVGVNFALRAITPVLVVQAKINKGKGRTKFYSLDLSKDPKKNKNIFKNVQALRALLIHNDSELLEYAHKPYALEHKVSESGLDLSFLIWRFKTLNTKDLLTVRHPDGAEKTFYRHLSGKRSGRNPLAFALDLSTGLLNTYATNLVTLSDVSNGNPGDTFMGKSKAREILYEGELTQFDKDKKEGKIEKPFISIMNIWKGWTISKKKALEIIDDLNQEYQLPLYTPEVLATTKSIQLYSIFMNIYLYNNAIIELTTKAETGLKAIYNTTAKAKDRYVPGGSYFPGDPMSRGSYREVYTRADQIKDQISSLRSKQKKYLKAKQKLDPMKQAKYGVKLATQIIQDLSFPGVAQVVGGIQNIFVSSQIRGFRKNDEGGDQPLMSNTLGEFGDRKFMGPMADIKNKLGMTDAEFFANWLIERI